MLLKTGLVIISLIIFGGQPGSKPELEPVWSVRFPGVGIILLKNDFDRDSGTLNNINFPISSMLISNVAPPCDFRENEVNNYGACIAPLNVKNDGSIPSGLHYFDPDKYKLSFVNESSLLSAISVESKGGTPIQRTKLFSRVDISFLESLRNCHWYVSPDGLIGILATENESFIVDVATAKIISTYEHPLRGVDFCSSRNRFTAIANHENQNQIVVINYQGEILYEEGFWFYGYWQLFFNPNGEEIICSRFSPSSGVKIVWMNIITKNEGIILTSEKYMPIFCSKNGKYLLVVQRMKNQVSFFELQNPFNCRKLWDRGFNNFIVSASVSSDGSLVAVQVLKKGSRRYKRIVILNKHGRVIAQAHDQIKQNMNGLFFIDDYLVAGFEKIPNFGFTRQIDVFKLDSLVGSYPLNN